MDEIQIVAYACQKFEEQKYDEALEAFILAYSKGYEQEWILQNIYACYMDGNKSAFQASYLKYHQDKVDYNECLLDFIPYKDGEYYIFDKELMQFRGKFSYWELEYAEFDSTLDKMEYSAILLEIDWNWNRLKQLLAEAKRRKVYVICQDIARWMSFWKIPELDTYLKNVMVFQNRQEFQEYFHKHTDIYLPQMVYGNKSATKELEQILEREHQYRLTSEGRSTKNVLLTIAIPTANRGNLVVQRMENLLHMHYDAEIEITVSKNGTDFYEEEYHQVSMIEDARVLYHDHKKSLRPTENWHYALEMAHGKYVMFVSDEDDVILSEVEHYLHILATFSQVSVLRAKSSFQGLKLDERVYAKKGAEAFAKSFLNQNYLSGLIVRREDFLQANMLQYEKYVDNVFYSYYPHEWWCAALSKTGDHMEEPVTLIVENDSVLQDEINNLKEIGALADNDNPIKKNGLPIYATYEERLKQFWGQAEFLHVFEQDHLVDPENNLFMAIAKTSYFLSLARQYEYETDKFLDYVTEYVDICHDIIDQFVLESEKKQFLYAFVERQRANLCNMHSDLEKEKGQKVDETI